MMAPMALSWAVLRTNGWRSRKSMSNGSAVFDCSKRFGTIGDGEFL
jgi:hypothetical protein